MESEWKRKNDDVVDRKTNVDQTEIEFLPRFNEATASAGARRNSSPIQVPEDMDFEEMDHFATTRFNSLANTDSNTSNDKIFTHKSTNKSIVSSQNTYDNDSLEIDSHSGANRTLFNSDMFKSNDLQSEATGLDAARAAYIDTDAAYALQLQQEEYNRESLAPYGRRRFPFDARHEHDRSTRNPENFMTAAMFHDQMIAREMFQNEGRNRNRPRPPRPYAPPFMGSEVFPQRGAAAASQTSDDDQPEIVDMPSIIRFHHQRNPCNDDDDDDDSDGNPMVFPGPYPMFRAIGHPGRVGPNGLHIMGPFRSRHRRPGAGLQDTEDDFGPEDYERLLQLDDSIKKKQLTSHQINKIKTEKFTRPPNNTDEENLCSICLERFEINETLRRYPCSHLFHQTCSDRWLKENNVCPICRKPPVDVSTRSNSHSRRPPHGQYERSNQNRSSQNRTTNSRVPGGNNRWTKNSHQS